MSLIDYAIPKDKKLSVSFGNKKLPKDTMIFNIPAVLTCPGKTEFCSKFCYALKAERLYPQVFPSRKNNLKISSSLDFVPMMIDTIKKNYHKIGQVRIHESGDFYNQFYLNKWFMIAREFPVKTFYAYTKSFHLDFSNKPANFVLIGSFDKTSTELARNQFKIRERFFDNTFTIIDKKESANCIQDCTKCQACWIGKGLNLTVNQH